MVLAGAGAARAAAPRSNASYSTWAVNGSTVHVRFVLPMAQAALLVPGVARIDAAAAAGAAGAQLAVSSSTGDCPAQVQDQWVGKVYILAPDDGAYRFEMTFACPDAQGLALHDHALFAAEPGHVDYAKVQANGGRPVLRMFTSAHQDMALPAAGQPLRDEGLAPFARRGLERLLGADALALVVGSLLLAGRWRDLRDIAAALALGYGAALALGLSGAVTADLPSGAAAIGFMAAVLGLCALRAQSDGSPGAPGWRVGLGLGAGLVCAGVLAAASAKGPSAVLIAAGLVLFALAQVWIVGAAPRLRLLLFAPAALFGLFDGAVWARDLAPLQMPGLGLAPAMVGYDLGAFAALTAAASAAMLVVWILRDRLKPIQPVVGDLAAAVLTGLGLFWFVGRLYGV